MFTNISPLINPFVKSPTRSNSTCRVRKPGILRKGPNADRNFLFWLIRKNAIEDSPVCSNLTSPVDSKEELSSSVAIQIEDLSTSSPMSRSRMVSSGNFARVASEMPLSPSTNTEPRHAFRPSFDVPLSVNQLGRKATRGEEGSMVDTNRMPFAFRGPGVCPAS